MHSTVHTGKSTSCFIFMLNWGPSLLAFEKTENSRFSPLRKPNLLPALTHELRLRSANAWSPNYSILQRLPCLLFSYGLVTNDQTFRSDVCPPPKKKKSNWLFDRSFWGAFAGPPNFILLYLDPVTNSQSLLQVNFRVNFRLPCILVSWPQTSISGLFTMKHG